MADRPPVSRRLRAADLFEAGWSQARVARELSVTRTTAMRWHRAWRKEGRGALARDEPAGRPRKLSRRELSEVLDSLPAGTSVDRVAELIRERTGVRYHPGHVWRVLAEWGWGRRFEPGRRARILDPDGNTIHLRE